jgi:CheY-like chemotaxis protein
MHKVLVIDYSAYRDMIAQIFRRAGCEVEVCESAFDAMAKLKAHDFDLIVSEVELPGDNAFDLYNYLSTYYPYIPAIMTTEKDIDTFFDRIFQEGIGNVVSKPIVEDEFISLATKLISRKNIFGLQNYLSPLVGEVKKIRIGSSQQIRKAIALALQHIKEWGFTIQNSAVLNLILDELTINAVYHSHGYTREKEMRKPVQLREDEYVDLFFAHTPSRYGISITDYKGKLSKMKILDSIHRAIEQTQLILRAAETGEEISDKVAETGRGIDLVRKLSAEYYFVIKRDVRTEIILLFDREPTAEKKSNSSLKIIEDAG